MPIYKILKQASSWWSARKKPPPNSGSLVFVAVNSDRLGKTS